VPVMVVAECSRTANNTWVCKRASRIRASRKVSSHSTSNARCVTYWKHLAPLPQTLHPLEHLYLHTTFASDYPVLTHPLPLTVNCDSRTRTHRQLKVHLNRIHPTRQQIHHVLQITPGIHLRTRKDCIYYTMSSRHRYRTANPPGRCCVDARAVAVQFCCLVHGACSCEEEQCTRRIFTAGSRCAVCSFATEGCVARHSRATARWSAASVSLRGTRSRATSIITQLFSTQSNFSNAIPRALAYLFHYSHLGQSTFDVVHTC